MFAHFDLRVLLVEHVNALPGFRVVDVGAELGPEPIEGEIGVGLEYGATEYSWAAPAQMTAPSSAGCVLLIRADQVDPATGAPDSIFAVASAKQLATSIQKRNSWREESGFKHILVTSTETGYIGKSGAPNADLFHVIRVEARKLSGV